MWLAPFYFGNVWNFNHLRRTKTNDIPDNYTASKWIGDAVPKWFPGSSSSLQKPELLQCCQWNPWWTQSSVPTASPDPAGKAMDPPGASLGTSGHLSSALTLPWLPQGISNPHFGSWTPPGSKHLNYESPSISALIPELPPSPLHRFCFHFSQF